MYAELTSRRLKDTALPPPKTTGGMPLLDAIGERHSTREFSADPLPLEELSTMLWAGFGLTRRSAGTGMRAPGCHAAPGAHNWQEVDIYAALEEGLYRYDAAETG
jgi:hypothetical protein